MRGQLGQVQAQNAVDAVANACNASKGNGLTIELDASQVLPTLAHWGHAAFNVVPDAGGAKQGTGRFTNHATLWCMGNNRRWMERVRMPWVLPMVLLLLASQPGCRRGDSQKDAKKTRNQRVQTEGAPRFAIHLIANPPKHLPQVNMSLSKFRLASPPLIRDADVVAYHWKSHRIVLKPEAFRRLQKKWKTMSLFIVTVGAKRLYFGELYSNKYSKARPHPVALLGKRGSRSGGGITIERAYPGASLAEGTDPRGQKALRTALTELALLRP